MNNRLNNWLLAFFLGLSLPLVSLPALAADYTIDTEGAHASINFKIPHLGYSFLVGRFDKFEGSFSYDPEQPSASKVEVTIQTASVNSNHEKRDAHIRRDDLLATDKYPEAKFVSSKYEPTGDGTGKLHGKLTLRGVTKDIVIEVEKVGEGKDPWGGYRAGFAGKTTLTLKDYGIPLDLGPASQQVELNLHVEGVKQ